MSNNKLINKRSDCRICGNKNIKKIIDLGIMPLAGNFIEKKNLKKKEFKIPLDLYYCSKCKLVQIRDTVKPKVLFKKHNVNTLFSTDKNVGSHRLPKKFKIDLVLNGKTKYNNIYFRRTDFRIENLDKNINKNYIKFYKILKKRKFITIYSHEYELKKKNIKKILNDNISLLSRKFNLISTKP